MDLGDLSFVSFSTLDEDLEFQACRAPLQVRNQLYQQLLSAQAKLLAAQKVQKSVTEQLRSMEVIRARLGLSSSNIANHPMVMKLSALTTTHHLLKSYQLVILRDMMRMKQALGTNVRRNEFPNVHNLFLLSLERHENEENPDMIPVKRFFPWRSTEQFHNKTL